VFWVELTLWCLSPPLHSPDEVRRLPDVGGPPFTSPEHLKVSILVLTSVRFVRASTDTTRRIPAAFQRSSTARRHCTNGGESPTGKLIATSAQAASLVGPHTLVRHCNYHKRSRRTRPTLPSKPLALVSLSTWCRRQSNAICRRGPSRCVTGENKVASLNRLVAGITALHRRFVSRFAVLTEGRVSPTASRRILLRVLDHELQVESVGAPATKIGHGQRSCCFPPTRRGSRLFGQRCTFRKWKLALPIRLDRYVVSQNGANVVEVACFVGPL